MGNYKLRVRTVNHKCTSSDGEWDGTWHTSYEWVIKDEEGIEVAGWDGYRTEEAARKAGEERLKRLEEARVKETGEFVEVHTCDEADFVDRNGKYYWEHQLFFGSLDTFPYEDPDYWTRLEHQYAGMAMQGMITRNGYVNYTEEEMAKWCLDVAHDLVEMMKEVRK